MEHQPHPTRHHEHERQQRPGSQDQHRVLDLHAEVFGDHLAAVLGMTGVPTARSVVDLGAGTGTGSRLLRERYPAATVTCVDNDPQMLEMLREQGFAVIEADLDDGFPALSGSSKTAEAVPVDLVWASSSLHHVTHAAQLLSGVRQVREYAKQWFARFSHLSALTADDRDSVEDLLERFPDDVQLEPRATRTVWVATPDQTQEQP
jgi:SAM-dependent methyltransferase